MAISNTATYAVGFGNGVQTIFDVKNGSQGIYFADASDLVVTLRVSTTITPQTLGSHYTVSGAGSDTGKVTFIVAPDNGAEVRIERFTPLTQTVDLTNGGAFNPTTISGELDKLTRVSQDSDRRIDRAIEISLTDLANGVNPVLPVAEASKLIGWDGTATGLQNTNAASFGLSIGSVTTGSAGSSASATIGGTATAAVLNLTIPRGDQGASGGGTGDVVAAQNLNDLASKKTAFDNLSIHGADVASAATIDLDAATGNLVDVTGTTTITAVTLSNGRWRRVRFTGALTLTHGANLVLPGAANIITAAGDYAEFSGYAAGVVRCSNYERANGTSVAGVANNSVTNAMLADVATATFKGRTTAGTGDPEDLTATQATAIINNMVGDSGAGGTKGLVPAPAAGDTAAAKFLKANGTWAVPAGTIGSCNIVNGGATGGQYLESCTQSVAAGVLTLTFTKAVDQVGGGGGGGGACFPAGSLVRMADGSERAIETIEPGDLLWSPTGPATVDHLHVTTLGWRKYWRMADGSLHWSDEHGFAVDRGGDRRLWSMNVDMLMREAEEGLFPGIADWDWIYEGEAGREEMFVTVDGVKPNVAVRSRTGAHSKLPLYMPFMQNNELIAVNGYVVAGNLGLGCDYKSIWRGL